MVNASDETQKATELATLAGGCFWCLDAVYRELRGVEGVIVGYAGGELPNPSYRLVCTGTTGHAEVVQISFDPEHVTYRELLEVFFTIHDPTTLNRQGPDVGSQYRSAIYFHDEDQRATAAETMEQVAREGWWDNPLVTELEPLRDFYEAEDYHQDYFNKNPSAGYCTAIVAPKVVKFRKRWQEKLKRDVVAE
jgi:peptide-methionine (S)-S-oxide reductase